MAWDLRGSILGPQGDAGPRGPQGDQGPPGENVSVWTGTSAQFASVDKDAYDLYLVTA